MDFDGLTYEEAVARIEALPKFSPQSDLCHTRAFLRALGNPEARMKIIHVAGTNGKGSVCAFAASILGEAGKSTGLFTSPHLVRINERFRINGVPAADGEVLDAYRTVAARAEKLEGEGHPVPTYFEMLFLMGMLIFQKNEVEYLVLETGLGGRLDATNSVWHPAVSVITSISLDHTEYLGETVAEIASEKAGIIKRGVPVVYDARDAVAAEVISGRAADAGAPGYPVGGGCLEILSVTDKSIDFSFNPGYHNTICLTVESPALYQVINAALAVTAVRLLDAAGGISDEAISRGVRKMRLRGRMEEVLPGVIIDGAHNAAGMEESVKTVSRLAASAEVILLFAAVKDKNYPKMIEMICRGLPLRRVVVTEVKGARGADSALVVSLFKKYVNAPVEAVKDPEEAFRAALDGKGDGILLCTGSLYLAGCIEKVIEKFI